MTTPAGQGAAPRVVTMEFIDYCRKDMDERIQTMYHPHIRSSSGITERRYHLAITLFIDILERHLGESMEIPEVKDAVFFFGMVTDNRCEFCWVQHPVGEECINPDCPG